MARCSSSEPGMVPRRSWATQQSGQQRATTRLDLLAQRQAAVTPGFDDAVGVCVSTGTDHPRAGRACDRSRPGESHHTGAAIGRGLAGCWCGAPRTSELGLGRPSLQVLANTRARVRARRGCARYRWASSRRSRVRAGAGRPCRRATARLAWRGLLSAVALRGFGDFAGLRHRSQAGGDPVAVEVESAGNVARRALWVLAEELDDSGLGVTLTAARGSPTPARPSCRRASLGTYPRPAHVSGVVAELRQLLIEPGQVLFDLSPLRLQRFDDLAYARCDQLLGDDNTRSQRKPACTRTASVRADQQPARRSTASPPALTSAGWRTSSLACAGCSGQASRGAGARARSPQDGRVLLTPVPRS